MGRELGFRGRRWLSILVPFAVAVLFVQVVEAPGGSGWLVFLGAIAAGTGAGYLVRRLGH